MSVGVEYNDDDLISVRVKGMNPGKAKIHATMTLPGGQKLTTGVEVTGNNSFTHQNKENPAV